MENQEIEYIDPEVDNYIKYNYRVPSHADDPIFYAYVKSVVDSEGFDAKDEQVDHYECMGYLKSTTDRSELLSCKYLVEDAKFAVKEFNRLKGTELVFRRLVRHCSTLYVCYMTLECTNRCFYEAKLDQPVCHPVELQIFRPAKHYHPSEKDDSEFYKYEMISPAA